MRSFQTNKSNHQRQNHAMSCKSVKDCTRISVVMGWLISISLGYKKTQAVFLLCAGVEIEGSGSFSNVSFSNEEQRVASDPNQQLHFPKPLLWWNRVHHLHQHQHQVRSISILYLSEWVNDIYCLLGICRQLQQQQAELEVHQRDGLTAYDLSQVTIPQQYLVI